MPDEPPSTERRQVGVADLQVDRVDGQPSASAAIWVSAVQVPVPMSAAPICTVYRPRRDGLDAGGVAGLVIAG